MENPYESVGESVSEAGWTLEKKNRLGAFATLMIFFAGFRLNAILNGQDSAGLSAIDIIFPIIFFINMKILGAARNVQISKEHELKMIMPYKAWGYIWRTVASCFIGAFIIMPVFQSIPGFFEIEVQVRTLILVMTASLITLIITILFFCKYKREFFAYSLGNK